MHIEVKAKPSRQVNWNGSSSLIEGVAEDLLGEDAVSMAVSVYMRDGEDVTR